MAIVRKGKRKNVRASGKLLLPQMNWRRRLKLWKRETPLERRLHSSIIKHLNEKPVGIPSMEVVNAVAFDLVKAYARQANLSKAHMARVERLARIEMTPKIGVAEKLGKFRNIIGKRASIPEAIAKMSSIAREFVEEDRLANLYLENVLDKLKGPI